MRLGRAGTRPWRIVAASSAVALGSLSAAYALPALTANAAIADGGTAARAPGAPPVKTPSDQVHDLTSGLTAEDLARSLLGATADISGATFTGDPRAAGLVGGFSGALGIDAGVALSSGAIATAADGSSQSNLTGPNAAPDITAVFSTPGDPDLDELVAPALTYDAADLEFDFSTPEPNLDFRFVFGSEEYPFFTGSGYDDVFAFYIDGVNCATVPDAQGGGAAPVSINTVNNAVNPGLFRSNDGAEVATELNGLTTTLTCRAPTPPGVHHLKVVVADTADAQWDTDVVIEGGTPPPDQPPVAEDQSVTVPMGTPTEITLGGYDAEGEPLTYTVMAQPMHGNITGDAPNITYTSNLDFYGVDSFTFVVNDGFQDSPVGNVAILVTDQEQSPPPSEPPTQPPTDPPSEPPSDPPTSDPPTSDPPTSEPPTSTPTDTETTGGALGQQRHNPPTRRGEKTPTVTTTATVTVSTRSGNLSGTGVGRATPWLGAAGISGALAGAILIMTARRRLAR